MSRLPILQAENQAAPLPTVRALEVIWQTVAARPLWLAPNFWRYIKLRRRLRLRLLEADQVPIIGPRGKVNDCQSCTDICCVGAQATVLLRLRDIATLHDIGRADLMTDTKPHFSPAQLAERPALRRQVESHAWDIFPVLKKDSMGACQALTRAGKCSLYPHWPLACARFPYALHLSDEEVFFSQRCQSFWIHKSRHREAQSMAAAAVASYNERIKDLVILAYAREEVAALGLLQYLQTGSLHGYRGEKIRTANGRV